MIVTTQSIVCTVTNNIVDTDSSLYTTLLSEGQACVEYSGRCCVCDSTGHSLRRCLAPLKNSFFFLNPEFGTHDPDGFVFRI